jgi:lipoprotein-anchoring transpeptidase ErfK/SrfK
VKPKVNSERRKTTRQPVLRRALFSAEDGLRVGEVEDIGAGGLRIRTAAPARIGSEIDIEIHAPSGDWVGSLRLRGRVVHAVGAGENGVMGVRLLPERGQKASQLPHMPQRRTPEPEWPAAGREPVVAPQAKRRLWPWAVPPAVMALLLLLLLWRVESITATESHTGPDPSVQRVASAGPLAAPAKEPTQAVPASDDAAESAELAHPVRPVPPLPLNAFERVEGADSDLRLAAYAQAPEGEASPALDNAPWIYARSGEIASQAALVPESQWRGLPGAPATAKDSEVLVEVDKSAHRLTLSRNGVVLRTFDVGLGRNDSTPEGDFRIAVKATNPAWRHNGRTIPAGSPQNRIGKRWMGLGRGETTTSYGIHPAKNTRAIGGNTSFGCIQMYPDDADALFRFCPLGTRVAIRA